MYELITACTAFVQCIHNNLFANSADNEMNQLSDNAQWAESFLK